MKRNVDASEKRLRFERPLAKDEFLNSSKLYMITFANVFIGSTGCLIVVIKTTLIPTVFATPLFAGLEPLEFPFQRRMGLVFSNQR